MGATNTPDKLGSLQKAMTSLSASVAGLFSPNSKVSNMAHPTISDYARSISISELPFPTNVGAVQTLDGAVVQTRVSLPIKHTLVLHILAVDTGVAIQVSTPNNSTLFAGNTVDEAVRAVIAAFVEDQMK
jgi:hypothetical protein